MATIRLCPTVIDWLLKLTRSRSECDMKVPSTRIFNCCFKLYMFQGLDNIFLSFTSSRWDFYNHFSISFKGSTYIREATLKKGDLSCQPFASLNSCTGACMS